jgi:oligopeptidase B
MIRGSGDHDDSWAKAARSYRRERGIEDAEAVIKAARRTAGLTASETCIYGRSAGGYVIGALVNRHPAGLLFGAAYVEEAFLDVLNTMSNPALPASLAEMNEFGNPARIEDFETMLRLSPVQNIPVGGLVPGAIFIICRTALGDIEVYAYESVKWITRLGTGLLYLKRGSGHFTETQDAFRDMAEDFCLLENWLNA